MTEEEQNPNINTILEPIDIDLDKLFSLSYTFDNLKSFMKNILKNQQIIADKIKDLEKKSSTQNEENKKFHIFQIKIDKKLKVVENNVNKTKMKQKINFHLMKSLMKKKKKMNIIMKICLQIKI